MTVLPIATGLGLSVTANVVNLGGALSATAVLGASASRLRARWLGWLALLWGSWGLECLSVLILTRLHVAYSLQVALAVMLLRVFLLSLAAHALGVRRVSWMLLPTFAIAGVLAGSGEHVAGATLVVYLLAALWWALLSFAVWQHAQLLGSSRLLAVAGGALYVVLLLVTAGRPEEAGLVSAAGGLLVVVHFCVAFGIAIGAREAILREEEGAARRVAQALTYVASGLVPMCAYCHSVRDASGLWSPLTTFVAQSTEAPVTEELCPDCQAAH